MPADLKQLLERIPFARALDIELDSAGAEQVVGRMAWSEQRCTSWGVLHGGALMSLGDTLGAVCAFFNLPEGARTATISSATNLMRAVREGTVTGTARPLHVGRSVIVVTTELHDDQTRLVATVTQTQAVLR